MSWGPLSGHGSTHPLQRLGANCAIVVWSAWSEWSLNSCLNDAIGCYWGIRWSIREAWSAVPLLRLLLGASYFLRAFWPGNAYKSGGRSRKRNKLQDRLILFFSSWGRFSFSLASKSPTLLPQAAREAAGSDAGICDPCSNVTAS